MLKQIPSTQRTLKSVDSSINDYTSMWIFIPYFEINFRLLSLKKRLTPEILENLKKQLELFNTLLGGNKFAVGDSLTLADLSLLATVTTLDVFSTLSGFEVNIKQYTNIENWYENMKDVAPGYQQNLNDILAINNYFVK